MHILLNPANILLCLSLCFELLHMKYSVFQDASKALGGSDMTAGPYYISMRMKMCHLDRGLSVLRLSTLMTGICAVELHQVIPLLENRL